MASFLWLDGLRVETIATSVLHVWSRLLDVLKVGKFKDTRLAEVWIHVDCGLKSFQNQLFYMIFIRKVLEDHKKTYKRNLEVTSDNNKQSPSLIDRVTTLFNYVYIENATGRVYQF